MDVDLAQQHLAQEAHSLRQQYLPYADTVYELRLKLETPLMISAFKADVPVPGLPNLDGLLQFAAFYWCVREATAKSPDLTTAYLWQVNLALRGKNWIDFPVPIKQAPIRHRGIGASAYLYDCSIGLPVDSITNDIFYPVGDQLLNNQGHRLQRVLDNLPLRRRIVEPLKAYKAVELVGEKIDSSRGAHKALDNRMYNSTTTEYWFAFRGDPLWVKRLLDNMRDGGMGIGKKSSLGYGQIHEVSISPLSMPVATLGHKLSVEQKQALNVDPATPVIALLKNIPSDELFFRSANKDATTAQLFTAMEIKILSMIPQLTGYFPPFWLKQNQTLVARYGSLLFSSP